ncbi:putative GTP pyrophosphokinase [Cucumis melo var. makuwa]|uniref:GTP pyrophosphokinase n=1 Tax=Cucumis melo var. makuwa TaxID=1194695 RepID=A0A5A7V286_CUCMM|nr:putative GTP pyrophosphokinase [Cucumis melo var. makuwa]
MPNELPPMCQIDYQIQLKEWIDPMMVRPYRYPHAQKNEIRRQVNDMMMTNIILPSINPFCSPMILVKKDGSWRFCVDYRALNRAIIPDKFRIPVINELLDELHGACIFSKIDRKSGYRVRDKDVRKTAFRTHEGHYGFLVVLFGLTNVPATFQAPMNYVFWAYLQYNLYTNQKNGQFVKDKIEYLGHWFVANYGTIVALLTCLTKENGFQWLEEATRAFETLKTTMLEAIDNSNGEICARAGTHGNCPINGENGDITYLDIDSWYIPVRKPCGTFLSKGSSTQNAKMGGKIDGHPPPIISYGQSATTPNDSVEQHLLSRDEVLATLKLDLPATAKIHPVFHVFQLKKTVRDKHQNQPDHEATWESHAVLKEQFPDFHLEDKVTLLHGVLLGFVKPCTDYMANKLRVMLLGMVDDPRVVLIKLADRLHNMRTIYALPLPKAQAVAQETLVIWCSLASRLGLWALKAELEDLCFAVLQPQMFLKLRTELASMSMPSSRAGSSRKISARDDFPSLDSSSSTCCHSMPITVTDEATNMKATVVPFDILADRRKRTSYLSNLQKSIHACIQPKVVQEARNALAALVVCEEALEQELIISASYVPGMEVTLSSRLKSLYSIYSKMKRKDVSIDKVYDARALRVVVGDKNGTLHGPAVQCCYSLLATVHK